MARKGGPGRFGAAIYRREVESSRGGATGNSRCVMHGHGRALSDLTGAVGDAAEGRKPGAR